MYGNPEKCKCIWGQKWVECDDIVVCVAIQTSGYESELSSVVSVPGEPPTVGMASEGDEAPGVVSNVSDTLPESSVSVEGEGACDQLMSEKDWVEVQRRKKAARGGEVKVQCT